MYCPSILKHSPSLIPESFDLCRHFDMQITGTASIMPYSSAGIIRPFAPLPGELFLISGQVDGQKSRLPLTKPRRYAQSPQPLSSQEIRSAAFLDSKMNWNERISALGQRMSGLSKMKCACIIVDLVSRLEIALTTQRISISPLADLHRCFDIGSFNYCTKRSYLGGPFSPQHK
jgi:hypothetical protein